MNHNTLPTTSQGDEFSAIIEANDMQNLGLEHTQEAQDDFALWEAEMNESPSSSETLPDTAQENSAEVAVESAPEPSDPRKSAQERIAALLNANKQQAAPAETTPEPSAEVAVDTSAPEVVADSNAEVPVAESTDATPETPVNVSSSSSAEKPAPAGTTPAPEAQPSAPSNMEVTENVIRRVAELKAQQSTAEKAAVAPEKTIDYTDTAAVIARAGELRRQAQANATPQSFKALEELRPAAQINLSPAETQLKRDSIFDKIARYATRAAERSRTRQEKRDAKRKAKAEAKIAKSQETLDAKLIKAEAKRLEKIAKLNEKSKRKQDRLNTKYTARMNKQRQKFEATGAQETFDRSNINIDRSAALAAMAVEKLKVETPVVLPDLSATPASEKAKESVAA